MGRRNFVYEFGSDLGVLESGGATSWGQLYDLPATLMVSFPAIEERRQSHAWRQGGRGGVRAGALSGSLRERMERKRSGENRAYSALGTLHSISSHPFGLSTMPGGGPYSLHSYLAGSGRLPCSPKVTHK